MPSNPIDSFFWLNRPPVGQSKWNYEIYGPVNPPTQLGVHGTAVAVDHDRCVGDGACLDACEVNVFEFIESPGHPTSSRKSIPARENQCTFCTACESVCPVQAIRITQPGRWDSFSLTDFSAPIQRIPLIQIAFSGLAAYAIYLRLLLAAPGIISGLFSMCIVLVLLLAVWGVWITLYQTVGYQYTLTHLSITRGKQKTELLRNEVESYVTSRRENSQPIPTYSIHAKLMDGRQVCVAPSLLKGQADSLGQFFAHNTACPLPKR